MPSHVLSVSLTLTTLFLSLSPFLFLFHARIEFLIASIPNNETHSLHLLLLYLPRARRSIGSRLVKKTGHR